MVTILFALTVLMAAPQASAARFGVIPTASSRNMYVPNIFEIIDAMSNGERRSGSWSILPMGRLGAGYRSAIMRTGTRTRSTSASSVLSTGPFGPIPNVLAIAAGARD
ncbi:hypothetical protein GX553_03975 [Candidatus Peribacteria bacterium]|nr:hypothetical protein [Candidatus Peribacteria bacterium]